MSRDAAITFTWGDGEHRFRLGIGELRELQEKVDAGPSWLYARIEAGMWRVDDLREPIRLGLIGGGMKPELAARLVRTYVEGRPLYESVVPAMKVLAAAVAGAEDEPPKVVREGTDLSSPSQTESSGSQASMEMGQSSGSVPEKSTGSASGNSEPASTDTMPPTAETKRTRSSRMPKSSTSGSG
jgi:hypothetical protein